jgi:hypothetical protein
MSPRRSKRRSILLWVRAGFFTLVLIGAGMVEYHFRTALDDPEAFAPPPIASSELPLADAADARSRAVDSVDTAIAHRRSGVMVDAAGEIAKILSDDIDGSRHQRFIIRLPSGDTVLIAHNIDLARKVPIRRGDLVSVRGQFEWNDRGGVIHWTHHDPDGSHAPGWVEHAGRRYQ